jgi:hypothetical protein
MRFIIPVFILACTVAATPPMFNDYTLVYANGSPIQVTSGHADPCVKDWNGDGLQDLLLGQYGGGNIRFYANGGSVGSPSFTSFEYLKADGVVISMPYG